MIPLTAGLSVGPFGHLLRGRSAIWALHGAVAVSRPRHFS